MKQNFKDTQKLTNVLKEAEKKGKLKIGFLGGSITQGCNPSLPENAYVERVTRWFKERFPKVEVEKINAGVGATGSLIGVHRVERDIIAHKPDLVFVEFAANDVQGEGVDTSISYESLIRKLRLKLPEAALVEIFMTLETRESAQEEEMKIAEHYKIPYVSYHDEIFSKIDAGEYTWEDIETDEVHPNDRGHGIVADLIKDLMEAALKEEIDASYKEEVPETTVFDVPYLEGHLIEMQDLQITYEKGFEKTEETYRTINTGCKAIEGADEHVLCCEVEGKNVFLLYTKGIEKDRATIQIKVNGQELAPLDTSFEGGWGNYPETYPLLLGDTKTKVTIEITMNEADSNKKLNLLGFLVS